MGLSAAPQKASDELGCTYFDAGTVVKASVVDGVHLDADQHLILGNALAAVVAGLLR